MIDSRQEYFEWITTAKGIGVFLVVLGHMLYGSEFSLFNQMIYSFHVPMFFILSGFVISTHTLEYKLKGYFANRAKRLLLPSVFFIALGLIMQAITTDDQSIRDYLTQAIYLHGKLPFNLPVWYFITLFEISLLNYITCVKKANLVLKAIVATLLYVLGYFLYLNKITLYFGIDKAIIAWAFLTTGELLRDLYTIYADIRPTFRSNLRFWIFIVCLCVWFISGLSLNKKISFYNMKLANYWMFILSGISGTGWFLLLSRQIKKNARIAEWARNSILCIGTHYLFVYCFRLILSLTEIQGTFLHMPLAILTSFLVLEVYRPIGRFLDKAAPFVTGFKKECSQKTNEEKQSNNKFV